MECSYSELRRGSTEWRRVRSSRARSGEVESSHVKSGELESGEVESSPVKSGQVRSIHVQLSHVWVRSGQVRSSEGRPGQESSQIGASPVERMAPTVASTRDGDATQPVKQRSSGGKKHLATTFFMLSGPSSSLSGKPWPCVWQWYGVVLSSAGPWCSKGVWSDASPGMLGHSKPAGQQRTAGWQAVAWAPCLNVQPATEQHA